MLASLSSSRPEAVFLDRDGVINENRQDHVKAWSEFQFLPGAVEAVARLTRSGVRVFVITNQAIVNRGIVPRWVVEDMHTRMQKLLAAGGGVVEAVAYCPHRPDEGCACRKPRPGLLRHLAAQYGLNLALCVVVGDALADVEAGRSAGCDTVLVLSGRGREQDALARTRDYRLAADLPAAAELILAPAVMHGRDRVTPPLCLNRQSA